MNPAYWLSGWREVSAKACDASRLLEVCRSRMIPYDGFSSTPDGDITVRVRCPLMRTLRAACEAAGLPVTVSDARGLPQICRRMSHRAGVCVGLVLGLCLLFISQQVVWDIRVSGTETLTSRDVKETLAACGFTVGSSLRGFAADRVENRALMYDRRLSWISINRRGTVAYVQVREATYPPDHTEDQPANLVASRAGVIERVELLQGNLLVAAGQTVSEGQLLISGLYDSDRVGFRWTHAQGHVYARTVREFHIEIPLAYQQSRLPAEAEAISKEKTLFFFGKEIKFSKTSGNEGGICDTIKSEKNLSLLPGVGFPVSVRTTWYIPVGDSVSRMVTVTRTPAEAQELAYLELARQIAAIPGGAELLRKTVIPSLTDTAFCLDVTVVCVEDIAREAVFSVTE